MRRGQRLALFRSHPLPDFFPQIDGVLMDESVEMNTVDVGDFLTDGALMRGLLAERLDEVESAQRSMVLSSSFTQGDVESLGNVDDLLSSLKELELFVDGVRGDIIEADQAQQFIDVDVTISIDGADVVVETGDGNAKPKG